MIAKLLGLLLAALMAATLATAPAAAAGIPIEVSADKFTIDEKTRNAVFEGNVVITRQGLDLRARTVTIVYGAGGQTDIDSLVASGDVRIKAAGQDATGERASFDPATQILRLTGGVRVRNAQGTLNGPELVVNLRDNTSVFRGSEGGRVTGVFTPQ